MPFIYIYPCEVKGTNLDTQCRFKGTLVPSSSETGHLPTSAEWAEDGKRPKGS